jgi:hypothetical protein
VGAQVGRGADPANVSKPLGSVPKNVGHGHVNLLDAL